MTTFDWVMGAYAIVIVFFVTRYANRKQREINQAIKNGWRCVGGNLFTGPIYVPPPTLASEVDPLEALLNNAYEAGWAMASTWADRSDLTADIGSQAYVEERDQILGRRGENA